MRTDVFDMSLPVKLDEEQRRLRRAQAGRAWPALAKQETEIQRVKDEQKLTIKTMEADKAKIIATAHEANEAAEKGEELRLVPCREEIHGSTIIVIRTDDDSTVSERAATEPEIRGERERLEAEQRKRPKGYTPIEKAQKLADGIAKLCAKPRAEKSLLTQLGKACPEATPAEVKDAVALALKEGRIEEAADGGYVIASKLPAEPPADDGIVPDDYSPPVH